MLTYSPKHNLFIWRGPFEERHLPGEAGFDWNQEGKAWVTPSLYIACRLIEQADRTARRQLMKITANVRASRQADDALCLAEIPRPENTSYYPFQAAGIEHMVNQLRQRRAVALMDEQGLGKSAQAIGVANAMGFKKLLVICPASLRLNWVREIETWHLHSNGVTPVLTGTDSFDPAASVVVSYDLATNLTEYQPDFIICDEIHYLKNVTAKRTRLILGDGKKWPGLISFAPAVLLSGTPLPNGKPNELWPVLFKCAPDAISYMKYWPFIQQFCEYESDDYSGVHVTGAKNTEELFLRLRGSGFMVRRLKKDVLKSLPPKRHKLVVFPATGPAKKLLTQESAFDAGEIVRHGMPVGSALPETRRLMGVEKVPQAVEYISDLLDSGTEKLLVFAYHREVNQMLAERLARFNPVTITGDTPALTRQYNVDSFQANPETRVAIGNLVSMGTGWTMTAAHDVVFVEASWVPGENEQCADRAHRIGQHESVMLHYLVVEGSLDARILSSAAMKTKNSRAVLDGAA